MTSGIRAKNTPIPYLFDNNTTFIELFIQEELGSAIRMEVFLQALDSTLKRMHSNHTVYSGHADYAVHTQQAKAPGDKSKVAIDVRIDKLSSEVPINISFEDYLKLIELRIIDNLEDPDKQSYFELPREHLFEMSPEGLLEAMRKFNQLASLLASE